MKKWLICLLAVLLMMPCALGESDLDVEAAVQALKECWKTEAYAFAGEQSDGYLEIKNTRIVEISDAPEARGENAEALQETVNDIFADVDYIVEFMLYSDMAGTAPYTRNEGAWDCVVVGKDGTMSVPAQNPINQYRARSYSHDVSGIVENVVDLNQKYNAIYRLMTEN